jgi:hypothetical protein
MGCLGCRRLLGLSGRGFGSWAMLVPIDDLRDETACCELQLSVLHPKGLYRPEGHDLPAAQAPYDRHRAPVLDYRCRASGKIFNVFTGTALHDARFSLTRLVMMLREFAEGVPTLHSRRSSTSVGAISSPSATACRHSPSNALPLRAARSRRRSRRDVPERR